MREDGRIGGGEEWQEKVYNREGKLPYKHLLLLTLSMVFLVIYWTSHDLN
jgi:hypothetical protein